MKKPEDHDMLTGDQTVLRIRPRKAADVTIHIPLDVIDSLRQVAETRDMSVYALIKSYIGQGLRQDLANLYAQRVMDTTAQVLSKHLDSEEELSTILHEIRAAVEPAHS